MKQANDKFRPGTINGLFGSYSAQQPQRPAVGSIVAIYTSGSDGKLLTFVKVPEVGEPVLDWDTYELDDKDLGDLATTFTREVLMRHGGEIAIR